MMFNRWRNKFVSNGTSYITTAALMQHSTAERPPYRVWDRDVSNAMHFGTLGHGHHGRYCVGLEIDALACFVQRKICYDGELVLCN